MDCVLTKYEETTVQERQVFPGLFDAKGRAWGYRMRTWEGAATEVPADYTGCVSFYSDITRSGMVYAVHIHLQREGKDYGAYPGTRFLYTETERTAYISKRLQDMKKRREAKLK